MEYFDYFVQLAEIVQIYLFQFLFLFNSVNVVIYVGRSEREDVNSNGVNGNWYYHIVLILTELYNNGNNTSIVLFREYTILFLNADNVSNYPLLSILIQSALTAISNYPAQAYNHLDQFPSNKGKSSAGWMKTTSFVESREQFKNRSIKSPRASRRRIY